MQNEDNQKTPTPPKTPYAPSRSTDSGIALVVMGGVCGGCIWTAAMLVGESWMLGSGGPHKGEIQIPLGTIITAAATLLTIVAGLMLLTASKQSSQNVVNVGKNLGAVALWLTVLAAAGYLFGFVVCLAGK
jgi:hypothetical protein